MISSTQAVMLVIEHAIKSLHYAGFKVFADEQEIIDVYQVFALHKPSVTLTAVVNRFERDGLPRGAKCFFVVDFTSEPGAYCIVEHSASLGKVFEQTVILADALDIIMEG